MNQQLLVLGVAVMTFSLAACGSSTETTAPAVTIIAGTDTSEISAPADAATAAATPLSQPAEKPLPSLTFTPSQNLSDPNCHRAAFVEDITVPDGWETAPGAAFTKTWRMQNTGTCAWESSYALVFDHGDRMSAPDLKPLGAGTVSPGAMAEISVDLVAPDAEGSYQAFFKLRAPNGATFGIGADAATAFWVKIVVMEGSQPPSATPKIEYTSGTVSVEGRSQKPFHVECPEGTVVTGGGYSAEANHLYFLGEYKEGNGWTVVPDNVQNSAVDLIVYAICLTHPSAETRQSYESFAVPGHSTVTKLLECPAGGVVAAGGFSKNLGGMLSITQNSRVGNGWQVTARNNYDNDGLAYVNVVCLFGTQVVSTTASNSAEIDPSGNGYAEVQCPGGGVISGVGWSFGDYYLEVNSVIPHGTSWRVYGVNLLDYGGKARLTANGVCLGVA